MFFSNELVLLFLCSVFPALFLQQIFENEHAVCNYFNYNIAKKEDQKLEMRNKLWNITGTGRNSGFRILFSPCGNPIPPTAGCGPNAVVCLINTKNQRNSILNAGKYFDYTEDEEKGTILRSVDGQPCSTDEKYTVVVEFACSPHLKSAPTYVYNDDCELRIRMMNPTCTPTCTTRVDGNLIDLRPLHSLGSITIQEPNTKKSFVLSFCSAAKQCGVDDTMACETTGGSNKAIAKLDWQRIMYDSSTNSLVVKSHFGNNKRIRQNTEINIKCKWDVQGIDNLKYIVPATQGRNYKFEGESSLACIKLPMNCVIKHEFENYWVYNVTSLNKEMGNWKVGNVTSGNIYINICGPLHKPQLNRNCTDQYSQACLVKGRTQYNLGSIPIEFHVTPDDTVKGKFVGGGVCATNQNLTYSTEIEFSCSRTEKGPVLNAVNNCTYKINWKTPAACSKQFIISDKCLLSDVTGNINLNNIHSATDGIHNFTQTSYLRYNFCGPLNKPCNGNEDVSVCYVNNGQEFVAGFASMMLARDNLLLSLILKGDKCNPQTTRRTTIYFHCNHSVAPEGNIQINMVKDSCLFEINIDTPLACTSPAFTECKVYKDNFVYDLTPLSLNNSNYLVYDSLSNADYIINVCHSVINFGDSLCPPSTGACMKNLTEPHAKYKYLSMGSVNSISVPSIENGDVVIHYTSGSYCEGADTLKRSTTIRFQCSSHEESPRLLKKDSCSHQFLWPTQKACPKEILSIKTRATNSICKYKHPHTGKLIDFSNIHKVLHISSEDGELYKFSVCEDNYTRCTSNDTICETIESKVQLLSNNADLYLEYPLEHQCTDPNTRANKIHIYLNCSNQSEGNEYFNFTGISNCIFQVNMLTNLACLTKESALPFVPKSKEHTEPTKEHDFKNDRAVTYIPTKPREVVETIREHDFQSDRATYIPTKSGEVVETRRESDLQNDKATYDNKTNHAARMPPIYHNAVPSAPSIIKDIANSTSNEMNKSSPFLTKTIRQNGCVIKSPETSSMLNLKYIKPIYVQSSSGFNYTVAINEPASICGGYICRNNLQIVSKTDECPAIHFNITYSVIKLLFNSNEVCDNGYMYHSEIWLKCNSTFEQPSIFQEEKCNVIISYPLQDVCSLLRTADVYSSNVGMPIYISVGLLVLAIAAIGGFIGIKKHPPRICSRSCYQQIPDDQQNITQFKMKEM